MPFTCGIRDQIKTQCRRVVPWRLSSRDPACFVNKLKVHNTNFDCPSFLQENRHFVDYPIREQLNPSLISGEEDGSGLFWSRPRLSDPSSMTTKV